MYGNPFMIDMASADLRYMQITIMPEAGGRLPGWALMRSFSNIEFLSHINTEEGNMRCLLRVEYEDERVLSQDHSSLEVLEVIEKSSNAALLEVVAKGRFLGFLLPWNMSGGSPPPSFRRPVSP
jgi:hypothetical protein